MIVNFSIQNFGSIKSKQTLSFEADASEQYGLLTKAKIVLLNFIP